MNNETTGEMNIDPLLGTPYAAVRFVARGASGEVWEARHRALGKRVAVKLLHGWHLEDLRQTDRLRLEAQALGKLRSPHLVAVHDLGATSEGRPYFVMDYLEGRTLDHELDSRGSLPQAEACAVAGQLLEALQVLHDAGVLHRDVKPGNLFYCEGAPRHLKLLDLGIAKLHQKSCGSARLGIAPLAIPTEANFPIGTPRYLSPEQIDGAPVDARCDIYAVGLVLYKLLTGRGPFDHHVGIAELLVAQGREQPAPPSQHAAEPLEPALDTIILKALAKRPDDRFESAAEFAEALAAVTLQAVTLQPTPQPLTPQQLTPQQGAPQQGATQPPRRAATGDPGHIAKQAEPAPLRVGDDFEAPTERIVISVTPLAEMTVADHQAAPTLPAVAPMATHTPPPAARQPRPSPPRVATLAARHSPVSTSPSGCATTVLDAALAARPRGRRRPPLTHPFTLVTAVATGVASAVLGLLGRC